MKYYEIWENNGRWMIYEVTNYGQHYVCIKSYKTKKGAESWASKSWYNVIWR